MYQAVENLVLAYVLGPVQTRALVVRINVLVNALILVAIAQKAVEQIVLTLAKVDALTRALVVPEIVWPDAKMRAKIHAQQNVLRYVMKHASVVA